MNCLEFRRRTVIDPGDQDGAMQRHMRACPRCTAFAERQRGFEQELQQAIEVPVPDGLASRILLRQSLGQSAAGGGVDFEQTLRRAVEVPVPDGLASRILLHQSLGEQKSGRPHRMRWLALAASMLLTVSLAGGFWSFQQRHALERAVFAHIDEEFFALHRHEALQIERVNDTLRPVGMVFESDIGTINFASICPIRSSEGAHLVLRGAKGPVSVFVMPRETVRERVLVHNTIRGRAFVGLITPTAPGSMAIVAEPDEDLEALAARVRTAVRYTF